MPKTKISEFSSTPANNTDIDSINIAENCPPSGINDAIRELMAQLKDFQTGAVGDSFNGPVGTSTAAAGAFTTLSASSTVTLSGGTANGVAYLNGSKVVTSGSALTFGGANLGVNCTATNFGANYRTFEVAAPQGAYILASDTTNTATCQMAAEASVGYLGMRTNHPLAFIVNNSEQMRLTSTGLGIGTSSPNYPATIYKATFPTLQFINSASGTTGGDGLLIYLNGTTATISNEESGSLTFQTAGTLRATLDSSGNLGLGVTPSAWGTSGAVFKAIEYGRVGNAIAGISSGSSMDVMSNAYYNAGWKYANTGSTALRASLNGDTAGAFTWNTAPSGTAGNAITFTQAMSLLAGGNLLVGKTSADVSVNGFRVDPDGAIFSSISSGETNYVYNTSASAYRFYVNSAGTVFATSTTISAISDQRFKENIRDLDEGLATVMALKPRKFDWKEGKGKGISNDRGFIAQEFEQVLPDMIEKWADPAPEGEEPYKAINANLIPSLVKAIQEQQAIINQLKARLDAANL